MHLHDFRRWMTVGRTQQGVHVYSRLNQEVPLYTVINTLNRQFGWQISCLCSISIYMFTSADGEVGMFPSPANSAGLKGRRTRSCSLVMANKLWSQKDPVKNYRGRHADPWITAAGTAAGSPIAPQFPDRNSWEARLFYCNQLSSWYNFF